MAKLAFYSVKGGTGRSLSLTNTAYYLSQNGYRVGCIDFDFQAPGFISIFNIPKEIYENKNSIVDILLDINNIEILTNSFIDISKLLNLKEGNLWLIPAKSEDKSKYQQLSKSEVINFATMNIFKSRCLDFFSTVKKLDYIFIDSRSGISNESLSALSLADKNIIFFTRLDLQSREMSIHFLNLLYQYNYDFNVTVVLTNIPPGNSIFKIHDTSFKFKKEAIDIINKFNNDLEKFNAKVDCVIPFDESLLIEHKLYTKDDDNQTYKGYKLLSSLIKNLKEI